MKYLLATALAAALALTAGAAPAQTGSREDDIAKLLFGLATVGIIAHAINERDDRNKDTVPARDGRSGGSGGGQGNHGGWSQGANRDGLGIPARQRVLPAACFTRVDTRRGPVRMFGYRCLQNTYRFADRLPARCAVTVRGPQHLRRGYDPQCLRSFGFTMARR